jgi:hypothetical protein
MSRPIFPGRYTAQLDAPVVLFLIGMRVNHVLDVRRWWFVARQMGPMLRTLLQHRDKGLMHFETFVSHRGIMMMQYWQSFEQLERFARSADDPHLESWQKFNRIVGTSPSAGIWHETYLVPPGNFEGVYSNMPAWGMAAATNHVRIGAGREAAKERLRA